MPLSDFQMPDTGFNLPDYGNNLFGAGGNSGGFPSMASSGNPALNTKGWLGIDGLGKNMQTLQVAGAGLQTLTGLWAALKAADIAKKQLAFTKATTNANLANQTQSYNTGISDRARARGAFEGQSNAQVADYISQNSLPKRTV